jgi:hypothetical protein
MPLPLDVLRRAAIAAALLACTAAPASAQQVFATNQSPVLIGQLQPLGMPMPMPVPAKKKITPTRGERGPWGRLEYYPVMLEAPESLVAQFPLPNSKVVWIFPESMSDSIPALLKAAGLDDAFIAELAQPASRMIDAGQLSLFPNLERVANMSEAQRSALYAELRRYPQNEFCAEPVIISSGDVDLWFRESTLRPELLAKIKQWSYLRGETRVFSDIGLLMNFVTGEAEARAVLKALTRVESLMVRLLLEDESEIPSLIDYWTTGLNTRRKDIEPLLRSVLDVEGVDSIGLSHLLPPLARKLYLTYPDPSMARQGILPDCHWSSLNFFNYDAQPYLLDSRLATSAVLERFVPIDEPYRFGDIIFFLDAKGDAFHSAVYLADNLIYSKNGRNVVSPWIITSIDTMKKVYLHDGNGRLQGYRNKQSPAFHQDRE